MPLWVDSQSQICEIWVTLYHNFGLTLDCFQPSLLSGSGQLHRWEKGMDSIRLSRRNGVAVELCGIAAMQWQEAQPLRKKNARIRDYLCDVVRWSRAYGDDGFPVRVESADVCNDLTVRCATHRSATILYIVQPGLVTIFWMAGFFREPARNVAPILLHS